MGGTFDPIHLGHIAAAEAARINFSLAKVIFVPAGEPPHKAGKVTNSQHRLAMVKLAIEGNDFFEISDLEISKPGKSYTVDTIAFFQELLGKQVELLFITGADAILDILTWYRVRELMQTCNFIAVTRPGFAELGLNQELEKMPRYVSQRVRVLEVPGLHISSTRIRADIGAGKEVSGLVPEKVAQYIKKYNLYR